MRSSTAKVMAVVIPRHTGSVTVCKGGASTVDAEDLIAHYPRLFHMTAAGSWPSISVHGLLPTSEIVATSALTTPGQPAAVTPQPASDQNGDVARYRELLAEDFTASLPDLKLRDKVEFLAMMAEPRPFTDLTAHDVTIRLLGDFAIVHLSPRAHHSG